MAQFTDKIEPKDFPKMPKEYQDLLTRLLTIQADCEIGGPHIYVDHWTLRAPTVDDQWRVARIAAEEIDHCRKMLRLLGVVGLDMFGQSNSARTERYIEWGLKRRTNEEARRQYIAEVDPQIEALGLVIPNKLQGRKYL